LEERILDGGRGDRSTEKEDYPKRNATCHQPGFNLEIVSFFYHITTARTAARAHDANRPDMSGKLGARASERRRGTSAE
jgi:hypothetical protein